MYFLSFSGHKFHAPRGLGFIYAKEGRMLYPCLTGGGQEQVVRSGTENVPAMSAMAKSLRYFCAKVDANVARQQAVRKRILYHVSQKPKESMFSQLTPDLSPHVLCLSMSGVRGETMFHVL